VLAERASWFALGHSDTPFPLMRCQSWHKRSTIGRAMSGTLEGTTSPFSGWQRYFCVSYTVMGTPGDCINACTLLESVRGIFGKAVYLWREHILRFRCTGRLRPVALTQEQQ